MYACGVARHVRPTWLAFVRHHDADVDEIGMPQAVVSQNAEAVHADNGVLVDAGRIGWIAKGIVYGLIGGLCCRGAVSEDLNIDASPQVCCCSKGLWQLSWSILKSMQHMNARHLVLKTKCILLAYLILACGTQGAFVLIGKGAAGIYILIVMAVALATYIIWRFWEGITAQVPLSTWAVTMLRLAHGAQWLNAHFS